MMAGGALIMGKVLPGAYRSFTIFTLPSLLQVIYSKRVLLFFLLSCILLPLSARSLPSGLTPEQQADYIMDSMDSLMRERLSRLDTTVMDFRLTKAVRQRVMNYVEDWPTASGRLLARSARFFPIFEEQLAAKGMPLALKYVTVQESALRPFAVSHASAGGLWQLMPGTARELGLTVTEELDERLDPELGCAAGLEYLRIQYDRYGDWSLALAAYNCGPGNVNKALKRSRGRSYWDIRKHLPRETRNYLPNIIAASYVMAFYHEHDLVAGPMELDLQMTEAITVYRQLSLYRVAQVTGLRPEVVVELNAQYLRGYLPGLPGGHRLRLPQRVMPGMRAYLARHPAEEAEEDFFPPWSAPLLDGGELQSDGYYSLYSTVASRQDTSLRQLGQIYDIPVDQLAVWSNRGELDSIAAGDAFYFYRVDRYRPYDPRVRDVPPPVTPLANLPAAPIRIPDRRTAARPLRPAPAQPAQKQGVLSALKRWFE